MAILNPSLTAESEKNRWATTWECFRDARHLYGRRFAVDVCAEPATAKVKQFIVSPQWADANPTLPVLKGQKIIGIDALECHWPADWWCNPPFEFKREFVAMARVNQRAGRPGMMLLPYSPIAAWWQDLLAEDVLIYEPKGRYSFYKVDGETLQGSANFDSVLVAFPTQKIGPAPRIPFSRGIHAIAAAAE